MRDETKLRIEALCAAALLARCGETESPQFSYAKNKSDARRRLRTRRWSSFRLMLNNRRYTELSRISYPRFESWNVVGAELRPLVVAICNQAISRTSWDAEMQKEASKHIEWDLAGIFLETEFADVMPPLYCLHHLLPIYQAGHLPCDWTGEEIDEGWAGASRAPVPLGSIVVY